MSTHVSCPGVSYKALFLGAALFASCVLPFAASAQSCATPMLLLQPEVPVYIDTCSSSYTPAVLCGGPTAGPAAVFLVRLRYPNSAWTFEVVPTISSSFDPVIVVQNRQCETGTCPFVIDNAGVGGSELLNLDLDSGSYYLIVTSYNADHPCGNVLVTVQEEAGGTQDGIFRSRFDY